MILSEAIQVSLTFYHGLLEKPNTSWGAAWKASVYSTEFATKFALSTTASVLRRLMCIGFVNLFSFTKSVIQKNWERKRWRLS